IFQLAGPGFTRQLPGTFGWRLGLQERQFVDNVRMHTLSNTQGLLSQRKRQCFSAGPNQETNSMGSHGGQSETKTVMKAWANASPKVNANPKTSGDYCRS